MSNDGAIEKVLLCPHGQPVQIGHIKGLFWYAHPDKSQCVEMNRYDTSADTLLGIMHETQASSPLVVATILSSSFSARKRYYRVLATLDSDDLFSELRSLLTWLSIIPNGGRVARELQHVFGNVFWVNCGAVNVVKIPVPNGFINAINPEEIATMAHLPKLDMVNLQDSAVSSSFDEIAQIVSDKKNKKYPRTLSYARKGLNKT